MDDSEDDNPKSKAGIRLPNPKYIDKRGFSDVSFGPDEVSSQSKGQLNAAMAAHQTALHTLQLRAQPIPSISAMQDFLDNVDTPEYIEKQLKELEKRHRTDLEKFYETHAQEHIRDTIDWYRAIDDTQYPDKSEPQASTSADPRLRPVRDPLDAAYANAHAVNVHTLPFAAEYSTLRHNYLLKSNELTAKLTKVKEQQLKAFPRSIAEYRTKSEEMQLRVAKFLVQDNSALQDRMMTEYDWPSRLVQPLRNEFKHNSPFAAELRALVMFATLNPTVDPRKR